MVPSMVYASPFREARRLQEEMERLTRSATAPQGFPAINVYAHHDGIVITAELPGVNERRARDVRRGRVRSKRPST